MGISFASPFKTSPALYITHCFSVLYLTNASSSKFAEQKSRLCPKPRNLASVSHSDRSSYLSGFVLASCLPRQPLSSGVDFPEVYCKFAPNRITQ